MDAKTKLEFIELFNQAFEEIILPHIVNLDQRVVSLDQRVVSLDKRVGKVENELSQLRSRIEQMDRKLDIFSDKVSQHEVKLRAIERIPVVAHQLRSK